MTGKKIRYGTVPINLLRGIHSDKRGTIKKMICYAIYDRMRKEYPKLNDNDFSGWDTDQNRIIAGINYFGRTINMLKNEIFNRGKELYDTLHGTPNASINFDTLLDYQKEKTEVELMVFSFYCAFRSMIGDKPYYKGTDEYLILRAFGYSSKKDFEDENAKPNPKNKDLIAKYSTRHHKDKIKKALQDDWGLVYVSSNKYFKMRGFYVSFKMSLKELAQFAKSKNKITQNKAKEKGRKAVIERVFNSNVEIAEPKKTLNKDVPF